MSAKEPLVSIIIPSYNYEQFIGQTIRSILSQTYTNWELIVCDDASTDGSLDVIRSFDDERITLLSNKVNVGNASTYNLAYARCTGEYFCCIDSDDYMAPERLGAQVEYLASHPRVDVLGTFIHEVDAVGAPTGDKYKHESWFNRKSDLNRPESWMWRNYLNHSSVMMRRALHERVGLWNEEFVYAPDYEFWSRCLIKGAIFHVLPAQLTYYRYHGGNVTHKDPTQQLLELAYIFQAHLWPHWIEIDRPDLIAESLALFPFGRLYSELGYTDRARLVGQLLFERRKLSLAEFLQTLRRGPTRSDALASSVIDRVRSEETARRQEIEQLREASESTQQQVARLQQHIDWLEAQRANWEAEAARVTTLLHEESDRAANAEDGKTWLKEQRDEWEAAAKQATVTLEAQRATVETQRATVETQRAILEAQVATLETQRTEVVRLEGVVQSLTQARDAYLHELQLSTQLLDAEVQKLNAMRQELTAASALLKGKDRELVSKEQKLASKNQELASKNQELALRTQELVAASSLLDSKEQELTGKNHELAIKCDEVAALTHELEMKRQELASRTHELASKEQELAAASSLLDSKEQELTSKNQELAIKCDEVAALTYELEMKRQEVAQREAEIIAFKESKLQRLKHSILFEPLSVRKLIKISYLLTGIVTPQSVRLRVNPVAQRGKRYFSIKPESQEPTVKLKRWPKRRPLISVVIPCYNYGLYVEAAIDSILAQTFQNFEIIVVDGGSNDGTTVPTLKAMRKPKTKIYFRRGRHLVGDNRNYGIKKAAGKYICCLDADDKLKPTYLEKALYLLETEHYDIVSTSLELFGQKDGVWHVPRKPSLDEIVKWNQFTTVGVFRREWWQKAGGYHDTGLGKDHIYEDWDFWVRLMALGARAINIQEPLMLYRSSGDTSLSNDPNIKSMDEQREAIAAYNQQHLQPDNFLRARERNDLHFKVEGGYSNLLNGRSRSADKTHILFALPFVITGGADTVLLQVAQYLSAHGFDISVLTTIKADPAFGDNTARYQSITNEIYHLYDFLEDEAAWREFVFYLIEAKGVEIIFIVGCAFLYDLLPEIKSRFPYVKVVDQLFNEVGHIENNRKHASLIDVNVVANETISQVLVNEYGETAEKIRTVVHGVDVAGEFNPANIDTTEVLASGDVPQDKFIISFMGRFSEEKRPEMFVDIAHALRGLDQAHFLMLGNGPEYQQVKQYIGRLDLEDRIYAPGFVADIRPFLRLSDVLVIPSRIEGIPIILMESLSLGVPVVASRVGGIPSILKDSETGFVCDPGQLDEFVRRVELLCADPQLCAQLKRNARAYAVQHLSVDKMNAEYHEIFRRLSTQGAGRTWRKMRARRSHPLAFNWFSGVRAE